MTVTALKIDQYTLSHLRELEAESIHIMREVASNSKPGDALLHR